MKRQCVNTTGEEEEEDDGGDGDSRLLPVKKLQNLQCTPHSFIHFLFICLLPVSAFLSVHLPHFQFGTPNVDFQLQETMVYKILVKYHQYSRTVLKFYLLRLLAGNDCNTPPK